MGIETSSVGNNLWMLRECYLCIKEVVNDGPGDDRFPVFLKENIPTTVDGEQAVDHPAARLASLKLNIQPEYFDMKRPARSLR